MRNNIHPWHCLIPSPQNLHQHENSNCHWCNIISKNKLDHTFIMRLQLKVGSKAYLHVTCIVTLKMLTPMLSFYSFNKASNFKPSSPNSLSKQYCVFKKAKWARNVEFALKFNQYKGYMILIAFMSFGE